MKKKMKIKQLRGWINSVIDEATGIQSGRLALPLHPRHGHNDPDAGTAHLA
jgi:hypothetical protein